MQVPDSPENLAKNLSGLFLLQSSFGLDFLIKTSLLSQLHNKEDPLVILKNSVEFDYVLVIHLAGDIDLLLELSLQSLLAELLLGNDLQSVVKAVLSVLDFVDLSERARAQLVQELKGVHGQGPVFIELEFASKHLSTN